MFPVHYLFVSHCYIFKQAEFTPEELNSRKRSLNLEVCVTLESLLETHYAVMNFKFFVPLVEN